MILVLSYYANIILRHLALSYDLTLFRFFIISLNQPLFFNTPTKLCVMVLLKHKPGVPKLLEEWAVVTEPKETIGFVIIFIIGVISIGGDGSLDHAYGREGWSQRQSNLISLP